MPHVEGASATTTLGPDDLVVDPPGRTTLFEECDWLHFMSASDGHKVGDVETREKNYPFFKKSTCKLARFSALYVDARRIKDDLPWDETGELITKNTPQSVGPPLVIDTTPCPCLISDVS